MTGAAVLSVEVPDVRARDVRLEPHTARPRKSGEALPAPTDGPASRMAIGGPVCEPLPSAAGGEGFQFLLTYLTATFMPANDEPFKAAEIAMFLDGAADDGQPRPDRAIAWSMAPDALVDVVKVSKEVRLNASLQIVGLGPIEPGVDSGWTRSATVDRKQAFLLAGNELRSDPYWRLRETDATKVEGMFRLLVVVRARIGAPVHGTLRASTWVERKRFGLWGYDARLPAGSPIHFTLG